MAIFLVKYVNSFLELVNKNKLLNIIFFFKLRICTEYCRSVQIKGNMYLVKEENANILNYYIRFCFVIECEWDRLFSQIFVFFLSLNY